MKVSVIGPGDLSKIVKYGKLTEEQLKKLIKDVAELLAKKKVSLVIVPARGIPYEIAKEYKKANGKKIIGVVPRWDREYGIEHIKEFLGIIDEEISTLSWYKLNGEIASSGDICVCIGLSPGVMTEICFLKYHYKFLNCQTKLVIFENTISKIPQEVEEDLENIHYIGSVSELEKLL